MSERYQEQFCVLRISLAGCSMFEDSKLQREATDYRLYQYCNKHPGQEVFLIFVIEVLLQSVNKYSLGTLKQHHLHLALYIFKAYIKTSKPLCSIPGVIN